MKLRNKYNNVKEQLKKALEKIESLEKSLEEKSETFKIYKTLVRKIDDETITPKEYFNMVFKIEDLKEDVEIPEDYLDIVDDYLVGLSYDNRMYTLDYSREIIDEVYDEDCDDWYLAECTNQISYDAECNVFVYSYDNTDMNCAVSDDVSCKRAPEWFKTGWEGLISKTLSEEEFINYYCNLRDNDYLEFSEVPSRINDFLSYLEESNKLMTIANCNVSVENADEFFDEVDFSEAAKTNGKLTVIQFVESKKFLEQFTPNCGGAIPTHFLDSLENSYLNTLLQVGKMEEEAFIRLLGNDNLNNLGINSGIDSFIWKYEEREPIEIFKLSELLSDASSKSSDVLLIGIGKVFFVYKLPTEYEMSYISKPFNENELVKKLREASRMMKLTQQRQSECSKLKKKTEDYVLSTIQVKKEIEGLNKDIQEMKASIVVKTANLKNEEFLVEKLEEKLDTMQKQKCQLDKVISNTWHDIYEKKECKRIFQKYVSEYETKLNSVKEEIKSSSDLLD